MVLCVHNRTFPIHERFYTKGGDFVVPGRRPPSTDEHHLLYTRKKWSSGKARVLRRQAYCKIRMPRSLHETIHIEVPDVPVPSGESARQALDQLDYLFLSGAISTRDNAEKRLSVLITLFNCSEQPTIDALKKQLEIVHEFYKAPR